MLPPAQLALRRAVAASPPVVVPPSLEVELLLDIIHGARLPEPDAAKLAARLVARGIRASIDEVGAVLERHGLKKTPRSRLPRSKH